MKKAFILSLFSCAFTFTTHAQTALWIPVATLPADGAACTANLILETSPFTKKYCVSGVIASSPSASFTTRVFHSVAQSFANATFLPVAFDSESYDPDTQHFTSSAALTGTVSKTASSATVIGSGTSFASELSVGQVFTIPGTATEYCVVTAIASNTSLTCSANLVNTASGQTGTRDNTVIVIRSAGYYSAAFTLAFANNGTGSRQGLLKLNNTTFLNYSTMLPTGAGTDSFSGAAQYYFNQWDFIQLIGYQSSGGALNVVGAIPYAPSLALHKFAN